MVDSCVPLAPQLDPLRLAWLREIGIDRHLLRRPAAAYIAKPPDKQVAFRPERIVVQTAVRIQAQTAPISAKVLLEGHPVGALPADLVSLRALIAQCQACPLYSGRSQTVFGSGATESVAWMVIGEAPGEHDDRAGLPFQGTAGVLLHAMLAAVGVQSQSSVFLTNLVKCRPLGNRTPDPAEVAACLPYLERQIALLKPRRILALGKLAAHALLSDESDFEQLRGRVHSLRSEAGSKIPLVVTYHPAYLLSRPQHKADAWRDLNLARDVLRD